MQLVGLEDELEGLVDVALELHLEQSGEECPSVDENEFFLLVLEKLNNHMGISEGDYITMLKYLIGVNLKHLTRGMSSLTNVPEPSPRSLR